MDVLQKFNYMEINENQTNKSSSGYLFSFL